MPEQITKINTTKAPKAIGPYSQAICIKTEQKLVFVSGQLPIDPTTGQLLTSDIKALTNQVIQNLQQILQASGSDLQYVVRTDVFLKDLKKDFAGMNEVYSMHFDASKPARQTVQVSELPLGSPIEISCIALVP